MSCAYKNRKKAMKKINAFKQKGLGVILHDGQVVPYCKDWGERKWSDENNDTLGLPEFDENTDGSLVTKKDTKCDCCAETTECYVRTDYGYDDYGNERSREQYMCDPCSNRPPEIFSGKPEYLL